MGGGRLPVRAVGGPVPGPAPRLARDGHLDQGRAQPHRDLRGHHPAGRRRRHRQQRAAPPVRYPHRDRAARHRHHQRPVERGRQSDPLLHRAAQRQPRRPRHRRLRLLATRGPGRTHRRIRRQHRCTHPLDWVGPLRRRHGVVRHARRQPHRLRRHRRPHVGAGQHRRPARPEPAPGHQHPGPRCAAGQRLPRVPLPAAARARPRRPGRRARQRPPAPALSPHSPCPAPPPRTEGIR
ncbi:hypothetical protein SGPA1_70076 [Streptomyces misionensis JCM 4497]